MKESASSDALYEYFKLVGTRFPSPSFRFFTVLSCFILLCLPSLMKKLLYLLLMLSLLTLAGCTPHS